MDENVSWFVSYLSLYSTGLPLLLGIFLWNRLQWAQKLIAVLALCSISTDIISHWLVRNTDHQQVVYHLYTIVQFTILVYIYSRALKPLFSDVFFRYVFLFFLLFAFVDAVWLSSIYSFNSYSSGLESLILIFCVLTFFYKTLLELKIKNLIKDPLIWISIGVLLYFSVSLFIFLFTNYINNSEDALFIIWGIHAIFNVILNLFFAFAIWLTQPPA